MDHDLLQLRTYLQNEYSTKAALNPSYSKRAFSRDLGLSPTSLNDFLSGKRKLSYENIDRIFKYLGWKSIVRCSWCDKPKKETKYLIGGPRRLFICDGCVETCKEIVRSGKKMGKVS